MDTEKLLDAVELIAASAWGTEAALRAVERGETAVARTLLEDCRRPLRQGLRDLRVALGPSLGRKHNGLAAVQTLESVQRLQALVEGRLAS